jgi:hypothetical protein
VTAAARRAPVPSCAARFNASGRRNA